MFQASRQRGGPESPCRFGRHLLPRGRRRAGAPGRAAAICSLASASEFRAIAANRLNIWRNYFFIVSAQGIIQTCRMAILARAAPKPNLKPAPLGVVRAAPVLAIVDKCVEVRLGGMMAVALPEGALWLELGRALVVADLHLEKGSALARRGQMAPPYDTRDSLRRLAALIDQHKPDLVVSLGDAFHDGGGPARLGEEDRAQLQSLIGRADWLWLEGNHEGKAPETLGGVVRQQLQLGTLSLRHEPSGAVREIAGHLHPCAKVFGRGHSVRRRCFAYDGERMVLPAFGAYAGGLNIRDPAFAPIFPDGAIALVLGKDRVQPAPRSHLLPD